MRVFPSWLSPRGVMARCVAVLVLCTSFSVWVVGAVSAANRELTMQLFLELAYDLDAGGRQIRELRPEVRAEVAECFQKMVMTGNEVYRRERERDPRYTQPSQIAPFVQAAQVGLAYATGVSDQQIRSTESYKGLKIIEASRRASERILLGMGQSRAQIKQQADAVLRNYAIPMTATC